MKGFVLILMLLGFLACKENQDINYDCYGGNCNNPTDITTNNPSPEDQGNSDDDQDDRDISGFYYLPDGGFFELVILNNGYYMIYQQQIMSRNYNGSLSYHPSISTGPHIQQADGSIKYAQNHNYSDTTHNLQQDGSDNEITGSHRTEYVIKVNGDGLLEINILIKETTSIVSAILVDRVIEEEL